MSFPRNSDVSMHLVRKPKLSATRPVKAVPADDSANTDPSSPSRGLATAVDSAQSPSREGRNQ